VPKSAFNFARGQRTKSEPWRCGNRKVVLDDLNRKFSESYGLIIAEAGVHMFDLSAFRNQAIERRLEKIILKMLVESNSHARLDQPRGSLIAPREPENSLKFSRARHMPGTSTTKSRSSTEDRETSPRVKDNLTQPIKVDEDPVGDSE
jgi:hypothetical protein